ncbi:sugar phosphate isomerase/epimerase family protein [Curtobacterium sp. L1-20]|uniref:sugar phosphate isomerase/epimerase family protein n=1 Tax=Curtobacterium sp. L1-20 TaxID=3138181 RepID=UPI003B515E2F
MDLQHASLNSITVRSARLPELLSIATQHGFGGVGLWRDVYTPHGASEAARCIAAAGLRVSSVCRAGMFVHTDEAGRSTAWDDNRRAIDEARTLGAECLVLVCGGQGTRGLADARAQIADGIAELAPIAAAAGVPLAIEPMHPMMIADRSAVTTLQEANDLIDELDADADVGIALDAYHVFWDVNVFREMHRAGGERLRSVQVSDWVVPIRHQLSSRGMPGEGIIDLPAILHTASAVGYQGLVEVEVLSDRWWAQPPAVAAERAVQGLLAL